MPGGDELRLTLSHARAGDSARGVRPQRMRELIAAVHHVVPGGKPHGDALANGVRHAEQVAAREARAEQRQAGQWDEGAAARDSVECQEQAGEHQRRPHVPLQKEERQAQRHRNEHRQGEFHGRDIDARGQCGQRRAALARVAEDVPTAREISRQEEHQHQQHADDLHRLETEQVYLGVAGAGTGTEQHQQNGERETGQQRHETQLAEDPFVVEPAEHGQQHGAHSRALGEIHEQHVIAHRVAQAHHENQADAAERQ